MLNLTTADLTDRTSPTAPLLDAHLAVCTLLDGPGDYEPIPLLDAAIERLREARERFAALAE